MKKAHIILSIFLAASIFAGCKNNEAEHGSAPLVQAVKAVKMNISVDLQYPAIVAGSKDVDVRAQVGGILKQKFFKEGDFVEEGQQLFLIDPTQYQIDLTKAEGTLSQAQSDMRRTKRDYDRMKTLYKENAVSRKDHDDALSAYERAQANVQVAQGGVDDAKTKLDYTKVAAPISGITRNDKYSEGNLISVAGEASFLVNIIQIDPLELRFSIPSQQWTALIKTFNAGKLRMSEGNPGEGLVEVHVLHSDGASYPQVGKMKFVDSSENPDTASISTKADVPNPEHKRDLLPGQFVKVMLKGFVYNDVVVIPTSSVLNTAKGEMVYVVTQEGIANLQPVKTITYKDFAIVEGLVGGETIISAGVIKVRPGIPVQSEMQQFDVSSLAATGTSILIQAPPKNGYPGTSVDNQR